MQLPNGTTALPGPGQLVGNLGKNTCPIEVSVKLETAESGLGLSYKGENLVLYKDNAPNSTADSIVHEFCHSAGMAAIGAHAPPPGVPQPKTVAQVDPQNECTLSTLGHLYDQHGHSGGHCARGLNDAQKRLNNYQGLNGTCINFGEGPSNDPSPFSDKICKTCATILKGRKLHSI